MQAREEEGGGERKEMTDEPCYEREERRIRTAYLAIRKSALVCMSPCGSNIIENVENGMVQVESEL
jgi:hypothetical protein